LLTNILRQSASDLRDLLVRSLFRGNMDHASRKMLTQRTLGCLYKESVGKDYGVTLADKKRLVEKMKGAHGAIPSATHWTAHATMATAILSIPSSARGGVVECGCYKGSSTASLSLVCEMVGRKLFVCDSFEGLPEDDGSLHRYPYKKVYGYYQAGMYAGALEEVTANVTKYGNVSSCEFVKGYFCDTLPLLTQPIVFTFWDVDLASSIKDCIVNLWPRLADGGYAYTDDSGDMEIVRIWFDEQWWQDQMGCSAPGYVGSGCGLPVDGASGTLGFSQKIGDYSQAYEKVKWLVYDDKKPIEAGATA